MSPAKNKSKSAKPEHSSLLQGWTAIAGFLGLPTATAQRWARTGMPVRKQGRFTVADKKELQQWLGRESHMPAPAQVVGKGTDLASALKQSISAARRSKK
jgi:phage terminase Nu1 subunit (DNA packaging protein)